LIHFILAVAAVPIRFAAWILAVVKISNPLPIVRLSWKLSGDSQDAIGVISLTFGQQGIRAAEDVALSMFEKTADAQVLATLCWLEIQQENDLDAAKYYLTLGNDRGKSNVEMLLPVKLFLSNHFTEYVKEQILDEVLSRNDLPHEFSRGALLDRAALYLKDNKWKEAEEIADRVLAIEDIPNAYWIKWVTAIVRGEKEKAAKFHEKLKKQAGKGYAQVLVALGWLYMGDRHKAMVELHKAESLVSNIEMFDKELAELTKSAEYYEIGDKA
jgi:tetratricopeptide (TPR) repeat protein